MNYLGNSKSPDILIMTPEKYSLVTDDQKKQIVEGHLELVAQYGRFAIIDHVISSHPNSAGFGPPGAEEDLHRGLHEDLEIPPIVVTKNGPVVAYIPSYY